MNKILFLSLIFSNLTWGAESVITPDFKNNAPVIEQALRVEKTKALALKGDGKKQYDMAYYYHHGTYVEKNLVKAKEWYLLAATSEDTTVRNKIARLYEIGTILPKDDKKAFEHYRFSAEKGDAAAQGNLSVFYWQGRGVDKNLNAGVQWAEKAALQGHLKSKLNLGAFYNSTLDGEPDRNKALKWFRSAADQGSHLGSLETGKIYLKLQQYEKAHKYLSESADLNNAEAMLLLAMIYAKGLGLPANQDKSIILLTESKRLGNKQAATILEKFDKY